MPEKNDVKEKAWKSFRGISEKNIFEDEKSANDSVRIFGDKEPLFALFPKKYRQESNIKGKVDYALPASYREIPVKVQGNSMYLRTNVEDVMKVHEKGLEQVKAYNKAKENDAEEVEAPEADGPEA